MKNIALILLVALTASFFIGCSKDSSTGPNVLAAYDKASIAKGGILYDKFWATEAGYDQNNPNVAVFNAKSDFFRCKQCHGWDLLGSNGSYNGRGPKTSRPNISALNLFQLAKTKTPQELFDGMKKTAGRRDVSYDLSTYDPASNSAVGDQMPNYAQILTDEQIWDLVKFMKEGAFDVSLLYDATYSGTYPTGKAVFSNVGKDGNAAAGKAHYAAKCAACHGADGKALLMESMTAGEFTRKKPNEVQHKVKYGQLGSGMIGDFGITLAQMKDLYKALADETAFPNAN